MTDTTREPRTGQMALRLYLGVRNAVGLLRSHVRSCEPLSADDDALIDGSLDRLREFAIEAEAAPTRRCERRR